MDKEKLIQRLMTTFLGELEEHVRALEQDLLSLDKDTGERRAELLHTLFRTAHSLKGAARSVSVRPIEAACHELEEILSALRSDVRQPSPELLQLLLATADALRDAERQLHARASLSGRPIETILSSLKAAARGAPVPASIVAPIAAPATGAAPAVEDAAAPAARDVVAPTAAPAATVTPTAAVTPAAAPAAVAALAPFEPELSPRPAPEARKDFARVSVDKLDALVARSGELLVARRRCAARHSDLAAMRSTLQLCRAEWQKLERPLRKLSKLESQPNGSASTRAPSILPRRSLTALERTAEALRRLERDLDLFSSRLATDQHALEQAAAPLDEEIRRVRMVPFADGCEGLERAVRDLARAGQKEVELVIEGGSVELDRAVLERLKDALLHLVRNAVDHGIETPSERLAAGKPARATLQIAASLRAGGVEISIQDDGRGINLDAVREQAHRRRLSLPEDERDLARLILLPGFSTAPLITELSGRGVGLDVVKHRVESLHGHVEFSSARGAGTRFTLTVPLTLTTIRALLLQAGGQTYALPATSIRRIARVGPAEIASMEGREVLLTEGAPLPLLSLVDVLRARNGAVHRSPAKLCVVVIASGDRRVALAVDEFVTEQDVVVKTLGARLRKVRNIGGATVLPTGRLALILTPSDLVEAALSFAPSRSLAPSPAVAAAAPPKRLLVVDDSVTTRSLEKSILEAAGYDVMVAADGGEAWQLLQEKGADLVVADVEMPRMDGFSLCQTIRSSQRYRELPVVLVTALASERDKARGLEVGADAYLVKGAFDQRLLLETVTRLT